MKALFDMIGDAEALVASYRARGLPIDAMAARIRLRALRDALAAIEGRP